MILSRSCILSTETKMTFETLEAKLHTENGISSISSRSWSEHCTSSDYQAFIFDCDGTLVDSKEVHFEAFSLATLEQGVELDRDWYFTRTGLDRQSLLRKLAAKNPLELDVHKAV